MGHKPLYRQIADRIREQIARGELKPGDALPTESALQTEFGVSRVTVRQALRQLVEQQILESIQGSGTYVKEERVNYDIFQLTSFDEKLSDRHVDTHSEVLIFEVIPADDFLQQQLQITAQDRVWHVKRVRYRKQKPMALEETWMPLALFPDLTWQVMENSKYHFIEEVKKMVIDRSEQEIIPPVSYTHLTLPTIRVLSVDLGGRRIIKKKKSKDKTKKQKKKEKKQTTQKK